MRLFKAIEAHSSMSSLSRFWSIVLRFPCGVERLVPDMVCALTGNIDLPSLVSVQFENVFFFDIFVYLESTIGSGGQSFLEINTLTI